MNEHDRHIITFDGDEEDQYISPEESRVEDQYADAPAAPGVIHLGGEVADTPADAYSQPQSISVDIPGGPASGSGSDAGSSAHPKESTADINARDTIVLDGTLDSATSQAGTFSGATPVDQASGTIGTSGQLHDQDIPLTAEEQQYRDARNYRYGLDAQTGETFDHDYGRDTSYTADAGESAYSGYEQQTGSADYGQQPGSSDYGLGSSDYTSDFEDDIATDTYVEPLRPAYAHDPGYVTKKALAICMIVTMLVSSIIGATFGTLLGRGSGTSTSSGSDSELSQLSLSDATGSEMTIAQIVDKNEDAVVEILVSGTSQNYFGQMQVTEGAGSGVIINSNGYIVTNYHVIEGANKVQVTLHNGDTYPATIIGGDNDNDIAVIKINATDLTIAEFGDSDQVQVGDTAVAIGNPLGQLGGTATTGIISALDRRLEIDGRTLDLLQTDAAINGGNSGGGLFNSKGELIGIVDAKSSGVGIEGLAFAIPVNSVKEIINDLVENGKVSGKPAVGIMIQEVSEDNAQYYGLEAAGVYIAQVTGENAEKAGFQQGDRIISFNGDKIESSSDFIQRVRSCKVGDTVSIVVSRSGQEIEIKTVLEELTTTE